MRKIFFISRLFCVLGKSLLGIVGVKCSAITTVATAQNRLAAQLAHIIFNNNSINLINSFY